MKKTNDIANESKAYKWYWHEHAMIERRDLMRKSD